VSLLNPVRFSEEYDKLGLIQRVPPNTSKALTLTNEVVLKVVYEEMDNKVLVITIYPAKKRRYE